MLRRLLVLIAACVPLAAQAQYPGKPIRIVLQFPAGGLADTVIRALANPLSQSLGQPIVVDNRPGADGAIAGETVKNAPPDGYTLFFATNSALSAVPAMRKNPPYDPVTDFTPISLVGRFPFFVFAHPSVPAKSLQELIAHIRANPGKLNYGSGNTTSILATAQLASLAKVDVLHVPYKGDAPLMVDLVAGRLHFSIASTAPGANLAKDGKLKVLATLLARRSHLFPDAPTMAESGFPQYSLVPWGAMVGPAGLPRDIVQRINRDTNAAVANAQVKELLDKFGFELQGSTPEELGKFIRDQFAAWRQGIRDAGIQPD
ncbi:MAG TPA: tripartite tricarboxylate transporter substrate binding protein [Burkholderiales bacterium]|jgi:tripartite-type tricarboxylate transporter receptor subunit TctC|nr:tripartite tricarboxylate transporter substrate binding protein [Burkholderiales bacterium]